MSSVLFDVPGPRARARNRILGVVGVVVLVAAIGYVLYRFYDTGQFDPRRWEWLLYKQVQLDLLQAFQFTMQAFALGAVGALLFGAVFAAGRLSEHAWLRVPATVVVEFFRAIPLVILMFVFYFGTGVSSLVAVVVGLTLYNGSVLAEVFRAGVLALPKGQSEAAYAIGMRKTQAMTNVLLPQSLRAMLPTIVSQLVVLLKDTSLGFLITYNELLRYARVMGSDPNFGRPQIPTAIVVAIIYIALCLLLSWLANYLGRRQQRSKLRPEAAMPAATRKADRETEPDGLAGPPAPGDRPGKLGAVGD
ncbi:amino acid ABC transporter permease [Actinoalloteichus spitiensis]|uniref:amino acid ABC transporter permease n=1 Tax=Actinoalloteichus spitiensis TaxID=252394 RepID=UPI0003604D24|nr:amino acid ABC transporter permease [Actinoalloteichus spitiensis]